MSDRSVAPGRRFVFLRAVNTGGRRLTNDQVVEPFRRIGLQDVAAYQAAGNVAVRSDDDPAELEVRLETVLADAYGFATPTFVRSAEELRAVVDAVPFDAEQIGATDGRVQVTFLRSNPDTAQRRALDDLVPDEDAVEVGDRVWYWLPRHGLSDSELPVGRIEQVLGTMTMRTLGTVERMLAKFDD